MFLVHRLINNFLVPQVAHTAIQVTTCIMFTTFVGTPANADNLVLPPTTLSDKGFDTVLLSNSIVIDPMDRMHKPLYESGFAVNMEDTFMDYTVPLDPDPYDVSRLIKPYYYGLVGTNQGWALFQLKDIEHKNYILSLGTELNWLVFAGTKSEVLSYLEFIKHTPMFADMKAGLELTPLLTLANQGGKVLLGSYLAAEAAMPPAVTRLPFNMYCHRLVYDAHLMYLWAAGPHEASAIRLFVNTILGCATGDPQAATLIADKNPELAVSLLFSEYHTNPKVMSDLKVLFEGNMNIILSGGK